MSSSPVGFATPDYESLKSVNAVEPATTAAPTGVTPLQIRQAYGFNQVTFRNGATGDGSGTTIAIVDAYDDPNIANDLHQFDLAFGLPDPSLTKVNQTGGTALPVANSTWITEIALDVEWSHAIAPKANILLVESNSNSLADLMTAVNYARGATDVVAVSMSWGGGEFSAENSFDNVFTTPTGHAGVSFIVASGDNGSPVSYPSASPNVLSVGGTSLYLNQGNYSSESGWSGSGGGISAYESQPSYQQGIVTQSTAWRTNPDVAYDSNPYTGFPVYDSYNNGTVSPWGQWGGTSDAAPQWAALVAIADQGRAIAGLGSLDGSSELLPDIYQLPASDFHDVTTGTSSGNPNYSAGAGYDLVTGRGTPNANLIIASLAQSSNSNSATHFSVSAPTSIVSGVAFSITVNALSASNSVCTTYQGTIQFSSTDSLAGVVLPSTYTFTAADNGSHTFSGVILVASGTQSVSVKDTVTSTVNGSTSLSVLLPNSPPVLSGSSPLAYFKNEGPTAISPSLSITDLGSTTLSSATITVSSFVASDDILSFVNSNHTLYGNIASAFNNLTGTLTLNSAGSTASVLQFQSALRAVTYFNQSAANAILGTRSVAFQVSDPSHTSNIATSLITISNANTTSSISSSAASVVFGQSVTLVSTVSVVSPGTGIPTAGTGTANVQFLDGTNVLSGTVAYSVVNGNLIATLTTSSLTPGVHTIKAAYSGDANFSGSSSSPLNLTMFRATTTCAVSSSMTWPVYGLPLTLTATVSVVSPGSGVPTAGTGTANVQFLDGPNVLSGTVAYSVVHGNLVATLTTSSLTAGNHLIQATYSGDANYLGRASASFKQSVFYAGSVTTVASSAVSTVVGQPVTLTATVCEFGGNTVIPTVSTGTATVKFLDGTQVLSGTVVYSVANGKLIATLTTSNLSAGVHAIKAAYSGDANFSGSSSAALNQRVGPFGTTSSISSSAASVVFGQSVTLVSTVSVVSPGTGIPSAGTGTANVQFLDGTNVLSGTVAYSVVNGNLIARLTTSSLTTGVHAIKAVYSGDANFSGSSSSLTLAMAHAATRCVVSSSMTWPVYGLPLTLTATVSVVSPGTGVPTAGAGTANVRFLDGSIVLTGTVAYSVVNGNLVATLTTSCLTAGNHLIQAIYSGDANYLGRASASFKQSVFYAGSVTTVASSAVSTVVGQPVTLTATACEFGGNTVIPTVSTGTATVKFLDGTQVLSGTVVYSVANGKLIATLTTSSLAVGIHAIKAVYSGDANFSGSSSALLNQRVSALSTASRMGSSAGSLALDLFANFDDAVE